MQKMSTELRQRVLTALVGAVFLILLICYGGAVGIFILSSALSLAMIQEFSVMVFSGADREEKRYILLFVSLILSLASLIFSRSEYEFLVLSFLGLFTYYLFSARSHEANLTDHFKELMFSIFGLLYLALLPTYLQKIHGGPDGVHWTIVFLLMNWSADTGAYFAGKKYGRTKLYPLISPKKTREGLAGGLVTALAVTLLYKVIFFHGMGWFSVIFVPLLVGSVAQVGDLCESFLKRAFAYKDSGSILPGHGGFLDRFDGVVFSLPIMYACIRLLG